MHLEWYGGGAESGDDGAAHTARHGIGTCPVGKPRHLLILASIRSRHTISMSGFSWSHPRASGTIGFWWTPPARSGRTRREMWRVLPRRLAGSAVASGSESPLGGLACAVFVGFVGAMLAGSPNIRAA